MDENVPSRLTATGRNACLKSSPLLPMVRSTLAGAVVRRLADEVAKSTSLCIPSSPPTISMALAMVAVTCATLRVIGETCEVSSSGAKVQGMGCQLG